MRNCFVGAFLLMRGGCASAPRSEYVLILPDQLPLVCQNNQHRTHLAVRCERSILDPWQGVAQLELGRYEENEDMLDPWGRR